MALVDNAWYVNFGDGTTTGYYALTKWSNHTAVAGEIIRQFTTPAVGSERVFVCTNAGATGSTEPTWVVTRGALNTSSVAVYQECTGIAALNGDATNTPSWTITATPPGGVKGTAVTLGQVIKRDNGASYQICTIAGTAGSGAEPAFSNTAGVTTADNTVTWTSLGAVGNFTGWQAPHARLANAVASTWGQAGNTFFLASAHAETQTALITVAFPGTESSPNFVYSVNAAGAVPPVSATLLAGATITSTVNNIIISGSFYMYGCTVASDGTSMKLGNSNSAGCLETFDTCVLKLTKASAAVLEATPNNASVRCKVVLINTPVSFAVVGSAVQCRTAFFEWRNTPAAIIGAAVPTILFLMSDTGLGGDVVVRGVDLSALGSGKTLVGAANNTAGRFLFSDCKLGASVTVAGVPSGPGGGITDVIRCDSGATNYRAERYRYEGTQTVETTIVRTGGASDGTTPISWNLTTTANSKWVAPFECQPITIWNDSTSAITLTIYGTTTGGGVPKDDEIWVEVEYLGSSLTPQGSFITTTKTDNLAASAATNNSSDGSTWGGGGAGNGFKIVVPSFTPGMKGPINVTVKVAKASTTFYIDPKPGLN